EKYGVRPITVHNTFSIASDSGDAYDPGDTLRLYWFSQTIGAGRGLEEVIRAAGRLASPVALYLRGRPALNYLERLRVLQREAAPALTLVHHDPAPPDDMVQLAQRFDAGLSCEETGTLNRCWCLGNKIFTYLAAGVPVVLSRTPAQAALAPDLGAAAATY